jgi:hypothetical protein
MDLASIIRFEGAKHAANAAKGGSLDSSFRRNVNVTTLPTRDFKAWQAFNYDLIVLKPIFIGSILALVSPGVGAHG